jgi:hypothetical protein
VSSHRTQRPVAWGWWASKKEAKLPNKNTKIIPSWSALDNSKQGALDKIAADLITRSAHEADAIGFITAFLSQVGMPHSDPTKWKTNPLLSDQVYTRKNGDLVFTIAPMGGEGHPFGSYPRYLMGWVQTEVTRRKNQADYCTIELGKNLVRFIEDKLKLQWGAGKRGNGTNVRHQAARLFTSSMALSFKGSNESGNYMRFKPLNMVEDVQFFENFKQPMQDSLWENVIKLTPPFAAAIRTHGFPFDWRVVRAIGDSPLGIDLYWCLLHWWHYIESKGDGRSQHIAWRELKQWFGPGYAEDRKGLHKFKLKAKLQLQNIAKLTGGKLSVGLNDRTEEEGIWIHRSRHALVLPE